MRAGAFSRKYAAQFFVWLNVNNPAAAKAVELDIAESGNLKVGAWHDLLQLERKPLEVLPFNPKNPFGAAKFPSIIPIHEIPRGKPFYFHFENTQIGHATGFQKHNSVWLSLPLDRVENPVPVARGKIELPKKANGKSIDPIAEEIERDLLEFLIIVYSGEIIAPPHPINEDGLFKLKELDGFAARTLEAGPTLYAASLLVT